MKEVKEYQLSVSEHRRKTQMLSNLQASTNRLQVISPRKAIEEISNFLCIAIPIIIPIAYFR